MKGQSKMKLYWKKAMSTMLCAAVITIGAAAYSPANLGPIAVSDNSTTESIVFCQDGQIVPYAEETTWYTRVHNGRLQKRLWSNTRGIWLTDWIDCAP